MLTTSENWKQTIEQDNRKCVGYITLADSVISDDLFSYKIKDTIYDDDFIGSFVKKRCDVEVLNVNKKYSFDNQEIKVYAGLKYEDDTEEYLFLGTYIVTSAPYDEPNSSSKLECYDLSTKFDIQYKTLSSFPCTRRKYIEDIANYVKVQLSDNKFNLEDEILTTEPYLENGSTFRDAIRQIAKSCMSCAQIIEDKLVLTTVYRQKTEPGKNICPTQSSSWEIGHYSLNGGKKEDFNNGARARLIDLVKVIPGETYYLDLFSESKYRFVIRTYDKNKVFYSSLGGKTQKSVIKLDSNIEYISVALYNATNEKTGEGQLIIDNIQNGTIKPFICLNSEVDKTFEEYKLHQKIDFKLSDYFELTTQAKIGPYNVLVLGRTPQEDNVYYPTQLPENPYEYRIDNNQIVDKNREQYIEGMYQYINGLEFIPCTIELLKGRPEITALDYFIFLDMEEKEQQSIVFSHELTFDGIFSSTINCTAKSETQTKYKRAGTIEKRLRTAELLVDKQNAVIEGIVQETDELQQTTSDLKIEVGQISQKVSQITIPLNNVIGNDIITLENTSNTDVYKMSIKGDISLLYGNNGNAYGDDVPYSQILYPSSNLFGKNNYLVIKYSDEDIQKIVLPFTYLNYINNEVCDEFKIDDGKAYIIRRVGVNSSMQKYQLQEEIIEEIPDFKIQLKEGNPTIYLESFDTVKFDVTYMVKNEYTDTFATKIELNSSITQTKDEINLEVSKKVDEDKVISTINLSPEQILLKGNRLVVEADNFNLSKDGTVSCNNATINGEITSQKGNIGGWQITSEGLSNGEYSMRSNGYATIYTYVDIFVLSNYLQGKLTISEEDARTRYDFNNDGIVNSVDLLILRNLIIDGQSPQLESESDIDE